MENNLTPLQQFGIKVKEYRKKANMTQKELAEKTGVTHEWICKIEKGKAKVISSSLIENLGKALDMNIEWKVKDNINDSVREQIE